MASTLEAQWARQAAESLLRTRTQSLAPAADPQRPAPRILERSAPSSPADQDETLPLGFGIVTADSIRHFAFAWPAAPFVVEGMFYRDARAVVGADGRFEMVRPGAERSPDGSFPAGSHYFITPDAVAR